MYTNIGIKYNYINKFVYTNKKLNNLKFDFNIKNTKKSIQIKHLFKLNSILNNIKINPIKISKLNNLNSLQKNNRNLFFLMFFFKLKHKVYKKKYNNKNFYYLLRTIIKQKNKNTFFSLYMLSFLKKSKNNLKYNFKLTDNIFNIKKKKQFLFIQKQLSTKIIKNNNFIKVFNSLKYFIFLIKLQKLLFEITKIKTQQFSLIDFLAFDLLKKLNTTFKSFILINKFSKNMKYFLMNYNINQFEDINTRLSILFNLILNYLTIKNNYKLFKTLTHIEKQHIILKQTSSFKSQIMYFYNEILKHIKETNLNKKNYLNQQNRKYYYKKYLSLIRFKLLKVFYTKFIFNIKSEEKKQFIKKLILLKLLNSKKKQKVIQNFKYITNTSNNYKILNMNKNYLKKNLKTKSPSMLSKKSINFVNFFDSYKKRKDIKKKQKRYKHKRDLQSYINKYVFIKSKKLKKLNNIRLRKRLTFPLNNAKSNRLIRNVLLKNKHIKKFNYQLLGIKLAH